MACSSTSAHLKLTVALLFILTSWSASATFDDLNEFRFDFSAIFDEQNCEGYFASSVVLAVYRDVNFPVVIPDVDPLMTFIAEPHLNANIVNEVFTRQIRDVQTAVRRQLSDYPGEHEGLRAVANSRASGWFILTIYLNRHVIMLVYPYHSLMHRLNSKKSTFNHLFSFRNGIPFLDITRAGRDDGKTSVRAMGFNNIFPSSMILGINSLADTQSRAEFADIQRSAGSQQPQPEIYRATTHVVPWLEELRNFQRYIQVCQRILGDPTSHIGWTARVIRLHSQFSFF